MRVLVLNAGSSTLKAVVLEPPARDPLASVAVSLGADASRSSERAAALDAVIAQLSAAGIATGSIDAVGHRVVHGGRVLTEPRIVDDDVLATIDGLADLAPLHNPVAAATIRAAREAFGGVPHVAAFDTAFHASLPAEAITYAVPARWAEAWGVRRFGFHGLAVEWAAGRAVELLARPTSDLRLVVAHLGSGCSVTAVDGGRSVDTSMGMTPLEGLVMGTRAGSLDPGILLRLLDSGRLSLDELAEDLDHRSGLLGLSGRSADVRELLAAEAAGDEAARLALAVFVRRAAAGIAAAATALPSVDALVFGGGIGEHSATIRNRIVDRLAPLGVAALELELPGADDAATTADRILSAPGASPAVVRIAAREDLVIAVAAHRLVATR